MAPTEGAQSGKGEEDAYRIKSPTMSGNHRIVQIFQATPGQVTPNYGPPHQRLFPWRTEVAYGTQHP